MTFACDSAKAAKEHAAVFAGLGTGMKCSMRLRCLAGTGIGQCSCSKQQAQARTLAGNARDLSKGPLGDSGGKILESSQLLGISVVALTSPR